MNTDNNTSQPQAPQENEIIVYQPDEALRLDVRVEDETVWLTQDQMAELFQRDKSVISRHIKNIFTEGELDSQVVIAKIATTSQHGAMKDKTQRHEIHG